MAVEAKTPIEVDSVRDEERFFGGDIVWWCLLLLVSIPVVLFGLQEIPDTFGFLVLSVGGIMAGVGFAQVMLRLPYFGNGFAKSMLIVLLAVVVLSGIALLFSWSIPVPDAQQDVMFKPPISGG